MALSVTSKVFSGGTVQGGVYGNAEQSLVRAFWSGVLHSDLPQRLAIAAIETHQRTPVLFRHRSCDENAIAPKHGCRITAIGQRDLPADVPGAAPRQRRRLLRGDAV